MSVDENYLPLVSVIMPTFNCASFIGRSIESVLNQTFDNFELIIIDDLSTDSTKEVVLPYLVDKRVLFLRNERNLGGAEARNRAIKQASGKYIAFLDSDDLWSEDKLEKQIKFMQETGAGFTYTGYSTMTEDSQVIDRIEVPSKVNFDRMLKHNYIGCLTAIYDTRPFGKIYMPLVRKRQDFALWLELLKKFEFAYGLQENLGFYRVRASSLSSSKLDAFKFYWKILRTIAGQGILSSSYNIGCYLCIVLMKKKFVSVYNKFFIN